MIGPPLDDPVAAGDAVAALRAYSLITPAGDGMVLVHRLVQAVILAQLSEHGAGQWKQAGATSLCWTGWVNNRWWIMRQPRMSVDRVAGQQLRRLARRDRFRLPGERNDGRT